MNEPLPASARTPVISENGNAVHLPIVGELRMPLVCARCGAAQAQLVSYTQDHAPLPIPISPYLQIVVVRTTNLEIPYCPRHAAAFHLRFKCLRITQAALYVLVLAVAVPTFHPGIRVKLGLQAVSDALLYGLAGFGLLAAAISIFAVKPLLYDVFVRSGPNGISIKSRCPLFIKALVQANSPAQGAG